MVGQLAMVVKRYGQLEKGLERTTVKWRKKEGLEEKIVALGGDGNLVKNMAELFGKHVLEGAME